MVIALFNIKYSTHPHSPNELKLKRVGVLKISVGRMAHELEKKVRIQLLGMKVGLFT